MKFLNKNIQIGENVKIGSNVKIGDNTVIYDNVRIGDNSIIANNCEIGEPPNSYYSDISYKNEITILGCNSLIRSRSIIYSGSVFGDFFQVGHNTTIRENSNIGNHCVIGSYNDIQGDCEVGDYSKFNSYVLVSKLTKIGKYVFIFPFTVITNDPMPPSDNLRGAVIGDYTQILASVSILPGTEIGMHCLISANSTVGGKFEDYSVISGTPGKKITDIRRLPVFSEITNRRHYPWPYNFERNMPWEKIGYQEWLKMQDKNK